MKPQSRIRFTPVPLKARHDGWTPARQLPFINVLAETHSITRACKAVGMSRESAYKLRDRPEARQFRLAWNRALRPDFDRPRQRSPRAAARLHLLAAHRKVDEPGETEGVPVDSHCGQSTSSALPALETLLRELRSRGLDVGATEPAPPRSR